jgi:hypothetical protein
VRKADVMLDETLLAVRVRQEMEATCSARD